MGNFFSSMFHNKCFIAICSYGMVSRNCYRWWTRQMSDVQWLLWRFVSMAISGTDLLEVPTIYKAYFSGLCKGISLKHMALYGTVPPFQDPEIPIDCIKDGWQPPNWICEEVQKSLDISGNDEIVTRSYMILYSMDWFSWEILQETMVFTIKYGVFL